MKGSLDPAFNGGSESCVMDQQFQVPRFLNIFFIFLIFRFLVRILFIPHWRFHISFVPQHRKEQCGWNQGICAQQHNCNGKLQNSMELYLMSIFSEFFAFVAHNCHTDLMTRLGRPKKTQRSSERKLRTKDSGRKTWTRNAQ